MKYLLAILIVFNATLCVGQSDQGILERVVAVDFIGVKNNRAVKILSDQLNYGFSYDASLLPNKNLNFASSNLTVRQVLYKIFDDDRLNVAVHNSQFLISKNYYVVENNPCEEQKIFLGRILDNVTLEPLSYAAVKVSGLERHTVANFEGNFMLSLPCDHDSVSLEFYALGYRKSINTVLVSNKRHNFFLESAAIPLQEVIIRSVEPELVLKKCLERIADNYVTTPANATAFFREATSDNDELSGISEAIFELYKAPYNRPKIDRLKLLKGRKLVNSSQADTIKFRIKGSIESCLKLDVIKNIPTFMLPEYKHAYTYKFVDVLEYNNTQVYQIDFTPKPGVTAQYFEGSLFIDENSFALVAIDFRVKPNLISRATKEMVIKKSKKHVTHPVSARYLVQYQGVEGKRFLSYVQMNLEMKVREKGKLFGRKYETTDELVVNSVSQRDKERIERKELFDPSEILLDQSITYDVNFWKGYDFFPLDQPLYRAVQTLEALLKEEE